MTAQLQPLDEKFPIVDQFGKPTLYFIKWCQQRQIDITEALTLLGLEEYLGAHPLQEGSGIQITPSGNLADSPTIAADAQEILDQISTTRGAILYRGLGGWSALLPGTAGQFLQTAGAGADPLWAAGGGGGGNFGTVDTTPYNTTGGPLSAPTETVDNNFGYNLSHASANITTNNFWFRVRNFSGDLTVIARILIAPQSNGNNSIGIVFRQSSASDFIAGICTYNAGAILVETSKSTNDGATSTGVGTSVTYGNPASLVPIYVRAVYVSGTNTLTLSTSLNGFDWRQTYSSSADITPDQVGFIQRIWTSTGPLNGAGAFKFWSDPGGSNWNRP